VEPLPDDPRLLVLRNKKPQGNVKGVNAMAGAASGKYLMKLDAHCMLAEGYDEALKAHCEYTWLAVPSRYQLLAPKSFEDVDNRGWKRVGEDTWDRGRGPTDYLYLTYPFSWEKQFQWGFHGKKWHGDDGINGGYYHRDKRDIDIKIDDAMAFQGSCWFVHRERFMELGGYDQWFYHFQEPQAIGMKFWLSENGRCIRNKHTWYAHLHKGRNWGRGYWLSKHKALQDEIYSADFWFHDRWERRGRDFRWYVEHFWPLPGWPDDWDNPEYQRPYLAARTKRRPGLAAWARGFWPQEGWPREWLDES
jgi:hypothetical protein